MEPASTIISRLGGPSAVAKIAGVHRTRVSNWMRAKERGGTGGRIPQDHHRALLDYARSAGVELSADELIPPSPANDEPTPTTQPEPVEKVA